MVKTERESNSKRREEKWQTCWCCRDQQRACKMAKTSAEKLEHGGRKGIGSAIRRGGANTGGVHVKK